MEIKFNGDFTVKKTPQEVYDFLVDPNRFCPLLPDYQSMEILDAKNFLVKLSVGISHIRGTAAVKMSLVDTQNAARAVYEGRGEAPFLRPDLHQRVRPLSDGRAPPRRNGASTTCAISEPSIKPTSP